MAACGGTGRPLGDEIMQRLKNLLGVFVASVLYFVLVYHLTNLYITGRHDIERFILLDGGIYTQLFWIGQVLIGGVLPLVLLYGPTGKSRAMIAISSVLVILGGLAQVYVIIIGGQAFPLSLFPGMEVSSSFFDGVVSSYKPSLPETLLGIGGFALSLGMAAFAIKVLPFLPVSLADADVDPHHVPDAAAASEAQSAHA
jgi:molybdopterin-containing oxidoreductase family membrane subunit